MLLAARDAKAGPAGCPSAGGADELPLRMAAEMDRLPIEVATATRSATALALRVAGAVHSMSTLWLLLLKEARVPPHCVFHALAFPPLASSENSPTPESMRNHAPSRCGSASGSNVSR